MAPMTTEASEEDGAVSNEEIGYLRRRAKSGVSAVITSCTYVDEEGKAFRGLGAAHESHVASLTRVAEAIHSGDSRAILQLYDAGRLAPPARIPSGVPRAPSAVASSRPGAVVPREMSNDEVVRLIEEFGEAASRAARAGFDGIELHGANHYLIHQFFSPRSNLRTDRWGDSLEGRLEFPTALVQSVRTAIGASRILGYRVTPYEIEGEDGITLADTVVLAQRLDQLGIDYLHLSLDNYLSGAPLREDRRTDVPTKLKLTEHPLKTIVRAVPDLPVVAVGGVWTRADAERMLEDGAAAIAVARAIIVNPDWPRRVREGAEIKRALPISRRRVADELDVPPRMVDYILGRPGLFAVEEDT
jgi:2,4-dienoyl-CoA reductase-like NADH-dependent reductase (Old Yellow Enzyme family)